MTSLGFQKVEDIFYVFGPFYQDVRNVGYAVLFVFLVLALMREFFNGMEGRANYRSLFIRCLVIAGAFLVYTPFFREVTHGMDLLANFFMPDENFRETLERVFTAYKQDKDLGMFAMLKMTFLEWAIQGTYNLAYAVMRGFSWIRLIFLSVLYLAGPILLGVGVYLPGMAVTWVRWLFEISSWNVVLSIFVRILAEMNFFELYENAQTPTLDIIAMNLVVILIIIFFVPMFSSMMIRGAGSLSSASGAVIATGLRQTRRGSEAIQGLGSRLFRRHGRSPGSYKGKP